MKKVKIMVFAALTVLLLASVIDFSVFAITEPSFTLSASSNQLEYTMHAGTTFNGSVSTTGTVRFWVTAPNGAQIVDSRLIDKTGSFSFVATQNGTYAMNFEEDMANSIQVTFSYTSNPQIPDTNNSSVTPIYLLVTAIIAVVGSILIIVIIRRRTKTFPYSVDETASSKPPQVKIS